VIAAPPDRRVTIAELRSIVADLAPAPQHWRQHVRHDPNQRVFHELAHGEFLSVWVISWMEGHDTGLHDHGTSSGAVAVVSGRVREERMDGGGDFASRLCAPGQLLNFDLGVIHRVTLHASSPPLGEVGAYQLDQAANLSARRGRGATCCGRRHPLAV
jgi:predicted metal-dependent enzyme (double-stranded beta helix superfamily)